jgi:hypothetical protein
MEEDDTRHVPHAHMQGDDDTAAPHLHILGSQFEGTKSVTIGEYNVPINPMDEFNCESCQ